MITKIKLQIYKKYKGDIDRWARGAKRKDKKIMDDNDWYVIDGFIQRLEVINNGLASTKYAEDVQDNLEESCEDAETVEQLKLLIGII